MLWSDEHHVLTMKNQLWIFTSFLILREMPSKVAKQTTPPGDVTHAETNYHSSGIFPDVGVHGTRKKPEMKSHRITETCCIITFSLTNICSLWSSCAGWWFLFSPVYRLISWWRSSWTFFVKIIFTFYHHRFFSKTSQTTEAHDKVTTLKEH